MCENNCKSGLMLYGAILNKCWFCFEKNVRENPECIHHSIRIPQYTFRTKEDICILDKDGNILHEPNQNYLCRTMTDVLMEELEHDSTAFTCKALAYMLQNNAACTYPNVLFHLYWSIFTGDLDVDDYSRKYFEKRLHLISTAIKCGWYEPALATTIRSKNQKENRWLAHLMNIMWVTEIPVNFDFKKLVWQFLERGEEFIEDRICTDYRFPSFKIEEKKREMGIAENAGNSCEVEDGARWFDFDEIEEQLEAIQEAIWLEYAEKMKKYISEYYSQECMKQPE